MYAACLVLLKESPGIGIRVLMLSSLTMLAVLTRINQWWDWEIRVQHLVNEITIYIICIQLFLFSEVAADSFFRFDYEADKL